MEVLAPVTGTAAIALLVLCDHSVILWHTHVNWPSELNAIEHWGSAWCNRILPYAALVVALIVNHRALRQLIFALPLQAILTHLLKWLVGRVRPAHGDEALLFSPLSFTNDAWPSGHAALAWTIAFVFAHQKSRSTPVWCLLALFVCWARLHGYSHFPSDLFAGALVGWIVAFTTGGALESWIESGRGADLRRATHGPWRRTSLWLAALAAPMLIATQLGRTLPATDKQTARQHITTFYADYLGREPDEPGLAAYTAQRLEGLPLLAIARSILDSDESRRRLSALTPPERVQHLHELLRHQPPSPRELARDLPLVEDLSRDRGRLSLLIMRLTWPPS